MGRAYGGVSAEQRQTQRRAALVEAALEIVGTSGAGRLTVAGLCAQAGLNERYFYENFATLDDVLLAVADEVVAGITAAIVAAVAEAADDSRAKARAAIGAAIEVVTDDPRKARLVFVEALSSPVLAAHRAVIAQAFVALIVAQAQEFYGPATTLRSGSWGPFAAAHLLGGLSETISGWVRGEYAMTREELIERSTDLFVLVGEHVIAGATDPRAETPTGTAAARPRRTPAR